MKISQEVRNEVVRLYSNNMPVSELMQKFNISRSSIYKYLKLDNVQLSSNKSTKISFREVISLKCEVERLRQENEIFRICGCSINSPKKEKLLAIQDLSSKYSIHILCKTLNILRSTYYHFALRSPEKTIYELTDEMLRPKVITIFKTAKNVLAEIKSD